MPTFLMCCFFLIMSLHVYAGGVSTCFIQEQEEGEYIC